MKYAFLILVLFFSSLFFSCTNNTIEEEFHMEQTAPMADVDWNGKDVDGDDDDDDDEQNE